MKRKTKTTNETKKILRVTYRNLRNFIEIFWAQNVWEVSGKYRFTGCRTTNTLIAESFLCAYAIRLNNISIPTEMMHSIVEFDCPEWWNRPCADAEDHLLQLLDEARRASGET